MLYVSARVFLRGAVRTQGFSLCVRETGREWGGNAILRRERVQFVYLPAVPALTVEVNLRCGQGRVMRRSLG